MARKEKVKGASLVTTTAYGITGFAPAVPAPPKKRKKGR